MKILFCLYISLILVFSVKNGWITEVPTGATWCSQGEHVRCEHRCRILEMAKVCKCLKMRDSTIDCVCGENC